MFARAEIDLRAAKGTAQHPAPQASPQATDGGSIWWVLLPLLLITGLAVVIFRSKRARQ